LRGLSLPMVENLSNVAGHGVEGRLDGAAVRLGSARLFAGELGGTGLAESVTRLEAEGKTALILRRDEAFLGILALADAPRPRVKGILESLKKLGVRKLVMLTGDNAAVAARIGKKIGVTDTRAELLPEDKLAAIRELRAAYGTVAMIGDGVNDAPALAAATVGIAMGGAGTAVALETADVALMGDDLGKLPFAVGLSRASRAVIRQNLGVSLGVIALLILASLFGWMALSWVVLLHEGSSVVVVLNALRLLRYE